MFLDYNYTVTKSKTELWFDYTSRFTRFNINLIETLKYVLNIYNQNK